MRSVLLAAALALAALSPAQAAPLSSDGSWTEFSVDAFATPDFGWVDAEGTPLTFEFTIAAGQVGTLTVVDTGFSGDRFQVYNHGTLLGSTSVAAYGDVDGAITFDADEALANGFSRGTFTLGAGTHAIRGLLFASATDTTIGGIKLTVSPVPEPASYALLMIGLGLLLRTLRRRHA